MTILTAHQVNVRNAIALRMATNLPQGISQVFKMAEDPLFRSRFNAVAALLAETITPEQAEAMIQEAGKPVAQRATWDLDTIGFSAFSHSRTAFYYDLRTGDYCTVRRRLTPTEVSRIKDDANVLRDDPSQGIKDLVEVYDSLDFDTAVEIFITGSGAGVTYRNAADLLFVRN